MTRASVHTKPQIKSLEYTQRLHFGVESGGDAKQMLLDEMTAVREAMLALAEQYGARDLRVFGSVARREDSLQSDVDLLVNFPRGYDLLGQRVPLTLALEELLERRVDLVPEHELNPHLRERVLREAVAL